MRRVTEGEGLNIIGLFIKNKYYTDNRIGFEQQQCLEGFGTLDLPQQIAGYKPRPLEGVWASRRFCTTVQCRASMNCSCRRNSASADLWSAHATMTPCILAMSRRPPTALSSILRWPAIATAATHSPPACAQWGQFKSDPRAHPLPPGVIGPALSNQERFALIEYQGPSRRAEHHARLSTGRLLRRTKCRAMTAPDSPAFQCGRRRGGPVAQERRKAAGRDPDGPSVGLAFSGGGIRSATFNLGVYQALEARGLARTSTTSPPSLAAAIPRRA